MKVQIFVCVLGLLGIIMAWCADILDIYKEKERDVIEH